MKSIKDFFTKNKNKGNPHSSQGSQANSPIERNYKQLIPEGVNIGAYYAGHATMNFTPQDRARQETLDWLNSGTSDSLAALLTERDRATKEVRRGPRTKGTEEVQLILKEPSYRSVEKLHSVQRRTGMTIRYGVPGAVAYNFSKSLGWNRDFRSQLPSLQLRDFQAKIKEIQTVSTSIPAVPFSPIDWMVLSEPTSAQRLRLQRRLSYFAPGDEDEEADYDLSPISEPGGWRDSEQMDITDSRPRLTLKIPVVETTGSFPLGKSRVEEGEYDPYDIKVMPMTPPESEATTVRLTPVCGGQVHQVCL